MTREDFDNRGTLSTHTIVWPLPSSRRIDKHANWLKIKLASNVLKLSTHRSSEQFLDLVLIIADFLLLTDSQFGQNFTPPLCRKFVDDHTTLFTHDVQPHVGESDARGFAALKACAKSDLANYESLCHSSIRPHRKRSGGAMEAVPNHWASSLLEFTDTTANPFKQT